MKHYIKTKNQFLVFADFAQYFWTLSRTVFVLAHGPYLGD